MTDKSIFKRLGTRWHINKHVESNERTTLIFQINGSIKYMNRSGKKIRLQVLHLLKYDMYAQY